LTFEQFVDVVERTLRSESPSVPIARPFAHLLGHVEWVAAHVTLRLDEYGPDEVAVYLVAEGVSAERGIYPMTLRGARDVANGIAALFDMPAAGELGS
jgi:hypothetical protein